jgi:hypothetical protein
MCSFIVIINYHYRELIVIVIAVLVDEFFIMQQVELKSFSMSNVFLRMEYAIKLKLFKVITFIVTVKLINKIIRSA